jgi:hypothetical protein
LGETREFKIITNFSEDVLKFVSLDAHAFMEYLQQVPGFENGELSVRDGEPVMIYFLDMEKNSDEDAGIMVGTDVFTKNMRGGSGVIHQGSDGEKIDAWSQFGRSSTRAPYVAVYNLSLQERIYADNDRLRSFIATKLIRQVVAAFITGELGLGEDRGLMIEGRLITSINDIMTLEMTEQGAANPVFAIIDQMDVFPTNVAVVELPSLE